MKLWINAGELSGDLQGGAVLRALRTMAPGLQVVGMGGDSLAAAGQNNLFHIRELSIMGVAEILGSLPRIFGLLRKIKRKLSEEKPDAVLLIDSPEFNFRVANMACRQGIPVYYLIPPKVWAWRTGRVKFLSAKVRRIFSILPFEVDFYRKHGIEVSYVGNPLVDLVNWKRLMGMVPVPGRIGLMPGSRKKEAQLLLPLFSKTAEMLGESFSYHCIRAPNLPEKYLRGFWDSSLPLHMEETDDRYAFMRTCELILAASGTATLETGLAKVPTVVVYKVNPLSAWLGKRLIKVPWISLTNLILQREAFPEFVQAEAQPSKLAATVWDWHNDPAHYLRIAGDMDELQELCGLGGSAERAAGAIWAELLKMPYT